jgi:hypothetical protein
MKLDCDPAFVKAVAVLAREGDGRLLVELICRGHPKTADEGLLLDAYRRGALKGRPGKAPDKTVARAVELYPLIKSALQKSGHRPRHGRGKNAAIACTLAYLRDVEGHNIDAGIEPKVENRLRRSRQPRKPKSAH